MSILITIVKYRVEKRLKTGTGPNWADWKTHWTTDNFQNALATYLGKNKTMSNYSWRLLTVTESRTQTLP